MKLVIALFIVLNSFALAQTQSDPALQIYEEAKLHLDEVEKKFSLRNEEYLKELHRLSNIRYHYHWELINTPALSFKRIARKRKYEKWDKELTDYKEKNDLTEERNEVDRAKKRLHDASIQVNALIPKRIILSYDLDILDGKKIPVKIADTTNTLDKFDIEYLLANGNLPINNNALITDSRKNADSIIQNYFLCFEKRNMIATYDQISKELLSVLTKTQFLKNDRVFLESIKINPLDVVHTYEMTFGRTMSYFRPDLFDVLHMQSLGFTIPKLKLSGVAEISKGESCGEILGNAKANFVNKVKKIIEDKERKLRVSNESQTYN